MLNFTNPWGNSPDAEAQRSDLWSLNLNPITDLVQNPTGVDISGEFEKYQQQALIGNAADYYTQRIVLPENVMSTIQVIVGTQGVHLPGYDEPLGPCRIDFLHEVVANPTQLAQSSRLYNLLRCWWMLGMAGQERFGRVILPLEDETSRPSYRADLDLIFHKGTSPDTDAPALDDGATYQLVDCWMSDLQIMDFDYHSSGEPASIVATLQVGAILPTPP
jgi:hypothetical protein